ncbi:MAG: ribosomal RNA small subunit methyltransferase A [Proteobacteria bacterium]|nr:MAG: ribosomal RNA small subunit methyltransferase A [Pseudomonadota bacterium]
MSDKKPANKFAKKSLGQNFLRDAPAVAKIVASIPEGTPLLLEIGPGRGAITTEIYKRAEKFAVLEKDDQFAKMIEGTLFIHGSRNHTVFHADALEFDWEKIWTDTNSDPSTPLAVAANLPYNVATEILFRLLDRDARIPFMVLMFQKEVGMRIAAKPRTKDYGIITIAAQNLYEVTTQQILKPGSFVPSPKVDSAVLEFRRRENPIVPTKDLEERRRFHDVVRISFAHRRKTLENSLAMECHRIGWAKLQGKPAILAKLREADINSGARAEELTVADYGRLFEALKPKA